MSELGQRDGVAPVVSVVVPAMNEEENIVPLYKAISTVLDPLALTWELVIADDGSTDHTWERVCELHVADPRVRGVRLSRNFGHQYALLAGLAHAGGDAVISMDADLQHPPSLLPAMLQEWRSGYRVVHTARRDSGDLPMLKRVSSRLFYRIYSALSGSRVDPGTSDFRLLDRQVLDELLRFGEDGIFLRGLVQWVGYPAVRLPFDCARRHSGSTKYTFRRMLKFAWTGVTSFSLTPLRAGVVLGAFTSLIAFLAILYAAGAYFLGFETVPGWASVLSILSFLFGVLFILLGIIGEYVGKILMEVKRRPRYLVRERIGERAADDRSPAQWAVRHGVAISGAGNGAPEHVGAGTLVSAPLAPPATDEMPTAADISVVSVASPTQADST